jgi:hypothetical protein
LITLLSRLFRSGTQMSKGSHMESYGSIQELEIESDRLIDSYLERAFYRAMSESEDVESQDDMLSRQLGTLVEDESMYDLDYRELVDTEMRFNAGSPPFHEEVEEILFDLQMMLESMISHARYAYGGAENMQRKKRSDPAHEGPSHPGHPN